MGEPLGHRVAAYFHAGMSPDPERRHKEVMRALQIADYDAWKAMESAREEVPEWWAVQMVHLEREIEEANKDYTPEGNFPSALLISRERTSRKADGDFKGHLQRSTRFWRFAAIRRQPC